MYYVTAFISTSIWKILISLIEIKFLVSFAEINYALRKWIVHHALWRCVKLFNLSKNRRKRELWLVGDYYFTVKGPFHGDTWRDVRRGKIIPRLKDISDRECAKLCSTSHFCAGRDVIRRNISSGTITLLCRDIRV